jgi:ribosomal protein S12
MSMLTETSTNSALASGRWVVQQDEYARPYVAVIAESVVSRECYLVERYRIGEISGVRYRYVPTSCSLMPVRALGSGRNELLRAQ